MPHPRPRVRSCRLTPWLAPWPALLAPTLLAAAAPQRTSPGPSPPPINAVVVVLDDVGHDLVGVYAREYACVGCSPGEAPDPCTPNLDALAQEGTRFTNVWSSPWCSPTRAMILTGKPAVGVGMGIVTSPYIQRRGLDTTETTIADLVPLSAAVGKWHTADIPLSWTHPLDCGFDSFAGTMWNLNPPPSDGPNYFDWRRYDGLNPPVQTFEYATKVTTDDALEQLATLNQARAPWVLYVAYHAIHVPFHCPPNPPPPGAAPCGTDWWNSCNNGCTYGGGICLSRAMMQALDAELGRLLAGIDATDTAIFVVGDNGTPFHAKGVPFTNGSKGMLYQGGINVPLIARVPGSAGGATVNELVSVSDLFTTVADLARMPVPPSVTGLDSVSLAQYVAPSYAAPGAAPRDYVYSETFQPNFRPVNGAPPAEYAADNHDRAIRNDRYKLIERITAAGTQRQFFRLYTPGSGLPTPQNPATTPDPHEQRDLMPTRETWEPEVESAFLELVSELYQNHRTLIAR